MDALRRAESSAADSSANDEAAAATAPATGESPEQNSDALQLEPINTPVTENPAEASNSEFGGDAAAQDTPFEPPTESAEPVEPSAQQQAQAACNALSTRASDTRRRVVFVVTGLATIAIFLVAYYLWQSRKYVAPEVPQAATLIEAPSSASGMGDAGILEKTVEATKSSVTEAIAKAKLPAADAEQTTPDLPPQPQPVNTTASPAPAESAYRIEIHKSRPSRKVPSVLKQAYRHYQQRQYGQAEQGYRQVLRRYPDNRDAMLGLAAIALHQGNRRKARYYYDRLLRANPADKTAGLALQSMSTGEDALTRTSQIKYWLQSDRDNPQLHFTLGNQYAAEGQWKEAQQAFFEAHHINPDNADYAFNLAVSLDQLHLPRQALEYYLQARTLAEKNAALFSLEQLDRRIAQLRALTEQQP